MSNPFSAGYYRSDELRTMGFARVGEGSAIARNNTIVGLENISIGDFVRIDGYTTLVATRGSIHVGDHVHICSNVVIGARGGVQIGAYSSLSHGVRILTAVDDFSGHSMTNSTLPEELVRVQVAPVTIGRHVPVGTGTIILPGVVLEEGAAVTALSLVNRNLPGWMICGGNPAVPLRARAKTLLQQQGQLRHSHEPS